MVGRINLSTELLEVGSQPSAQHFLCLYVSVSVPQEEVSKDKCSSDTGNYIKLKNLSKFDFWVETDICCLVFNHF